MYEPLQDEGDDIYLEQNLLIPNAPKVTGTIQPLNMEVRYTLVSAGCSEWTSIRLSSTAHTLMDLRAAIAKKVNEANPGALDLKKLRIDLFWPEGYPIEEPKGDEERNLKEWKMDLQQQVIAMIVPRRIDDDLNLEALGVFNFALDAEYYIRMSNPQTAKGMSLFMASLYVKVKELVRSPESKKRAFLGHLFALTRCPPFILAFYLLILNESLSTPHRHLICEVMFYVARVVVGDFVENQEVFERITEVWAFLDATCNEAKSQFTLPFARNTTCQLSDPPERLQDPVAIFGQDDGVLYSMAAVRTLVSQKKQIPGVGLVTQKELVPNPYLARVMLSRQPKVPESDSATWTVYEWLAPLETGGEILRDLKLDTGRLCKGSCQLVHPVLIKLGMPFPVLTIFRGEIYVCLGFKGSSGKDPTEVTIWHPAKSQKYVRVTMAELQKNAEAYWKDIVFCSAEICTAPWAPKLESESKEAIQVIMDTSGSMESPFNKQEACSRLDAIIDFFTSLGDRTAAYNCPHSLGVITVGGPPIQRCQLTPSPEKFIRAINQLKASGTTPLYDALTMASESLASYGNKNCLRRVLCLSDGENNNSKKTGYDVYLYMFENKITLDAVLLGNEFDRYLRAISQETLGVCLNPKTRKAGSRLFQSEPMISLRYRHRDDKALKQFLDPNTKPMPKDKFEELAMELRRAPCAEAFAAPPPLPEFKMKTMKVDVSIARAQAEGAGGDRARRRRIVQELSKLGGINSHIHVFQTEDITFWRVLMEGPGDTPYGKALFELYVRFSHSYPTTPPEVRFLTRIYHCNINDTGKICHSIFDRDYKVQLSVREILECVWVLLRNEASDDPLDSVLAEEKHTDPSLYAVKAKEYTVAHAIPKPAGEVDYATLLRRFQS